MFILLVVGVSASSASARVLTAADARSLALEFNRTYLQAAEDVNKAHGDILEARSGALPEITLSGQYNRNLKLPSFFVNPDSGDAVEFKTGFKNDFGATLSLRQSIWKGGRVFAAWQIAKMYEKYSQAGVDMVAAEVGKTAEVMFYRVALLESNLEALNKSLEANTKNLDVVEKKYSQGLVSEYELLRAKVERSNLLPQIIQAESDLKLARKELKSFIGLDLDEEVVVDDSDTDTSLTTLPAMTDVIDSALSRRPELHQAEMLVTITKKAIGVGRADYYPELEAVSNYTWASQSDDFTLDENQTKSWSAGLRLTIPIFRGGATRGTVTKYIAENRQAMLADKQLRDDIRLEVEGAYDRLVQAKKALDIQVETIAQAEEGLRIANVSYESGVGTQLEVLSAQAALTAARNARALAMFQFRQAKSELKRAAMLEI